MPYKIEKFKVEDWYNIEPRKEVQATLDILKEEVLWQDAYTNGMPIFTMWENNEIVMIYGFLYSGCHTYCPVLIPCKDIHKYTKHIIKLFYDYFATYIPRNCRRLEAYCDIMDVKAIRLAKHFGFNPIGIRHNATAEGHDQVILERLTYADPRKIRK